MKQRILPRYYAQNIYDAFFLQNDHLAKDEPQETLFQHDNSWSTIEKDTKP